MEELHTCRRFAVALSREGPLGLMLGGTAGGGLSILSSSPGYGNSVLMPSNT